MCPPRLSCCSDWPWMKLMQFSKYQLQEFNMPQVRTRDRTYSTLWYFFYKDPLVFSPYSLSTILTITTSYWSPRIWTNLTCPSIHQMVQMHSSTSTLHSDIRSKENILALGNLMIIEMTLLKLKNSSDLYWPYCLHLQFAHETPKKVLKLAGAEQEVFP